MFRSRVWTSLCVAIVLFAITDLIALKLYLFWAVWWFDIVMHTFGGFVIGLASVFVASIYTRTYISLLIYMVCTVLVVGLGWEYFELYFKLTDMDTLGYICDTGMDIIADLAGGMVALGYAKVLHYE